MRSKKQLVKSHVQFKVQNASGGTDLVVSTDWREENNRGRCRIGPLVSTACAEGRTGRPSTAPETGACMPMGQENR